MLLVVLTTIVDACCAISLYSTNILFGNLESKIFTLTTVLTIKRSTYVRARGPIVVHMCGSTYYCKTATAMGVMDGNAPVNKSCYYKTL